MKWHGALALAVAIGAFGMPAAVPAAGGDDTGAIAETQAFAYERGEVKLFHAGVTTGTRSKSSRS